jgi:solute carrier family 25 protein 39/40
MLTYDHLLNVVFPPLIPPSITPLVSGVLARTFISTITSPFELVRTNLQSTPSSNKPLTLYSVLTSIRTLVRNHGIFSLWRGLGPTLWRDVPFSGIYWAGYESCKTAFAQNGFSGIWVSFISGSLSGTTAAFATSPFDVLKTRRQALVMSSSSARNASSSKLLFQIVRVEGVATLFAGILPRIAKIAPACGIMIACFEVRVLFLSLSFRPLTWLRFYQGHWWIPC